MHSQGAISYIYTNIFSVKEQKWACCRRERSSSFGGINELGGFFEYLPLMNMSFPEVMTCTVTVIGWICILVQPIRVGQNLITLSRSWMGDWLWWQIYGRRSTTVHTLLVKGYERYTENYDRSRSGRQEYDIPDHYVRCVYFSQPFLFLVQGTLEYCGIPPTKGMASQVVTLQILLSVTWNYCGVSPTTSLSPWAVSHPSNSYLV